MPVGVHLVVCDLESVDAMAEAAMAAFGTPAVLVNSAAIFSTLAMRPFDEIQVEECA